MMLSFSASYIVIWCKTSKSGIHVLSGCVCSVLFFLTRRILGSILKICTQKYDQSTLMVLMKPYLSVYHEFFLCSSHNIFLLFNYFLFFLTTFLSYFTLRITIESFIDKLGCVEMEICFDPKFVLSREVLLYSP